MAPSVVAASARRRPCAVRTPTPRAALWGGLSHATTSVGWRYSARHSTLRPALRAAHAAQPVLLSGRPPPPPGRDGGPVLPRGAPGRGPAPFFSFRHAGVGTDVQHAGGVPHPTRMQGHLDDRLFDCRRLPWGTI